MSGSRMISLLTCACVLGAASTVTLAAEKRMRFSVDVKVEGTEGVVGAGTDRESPPSAEAFGHGGEVLSGPLQNVAVHGSRPSACHRPGGRTSPGSCSTFNHSIEALDSRAGRSAGE